MNATDTTIVITTRNRADSLEHTLTRLTEHGEPWPIFVVDNAAAGRNFGVQAAGTRYVAFADDDSWWDPASLAR
ncbi:glycosyltransferase family 2 protein [Tomitella gaofuii]|uniref:glycosyltransferase family 2 protein n=1 Tax=Tomitella gaofuii TaxID=2760083 RepID=UPI001C70FB91|nr:glycosyltransferase family A protein [Tomitella gaofuii]